MEIVESSAPSKVAIKLDFLKPFEGHNIATFTMEPGGGATDVTWAMDGPTPFVGKIMHVFINMDRMVGTDFEAGLANLKTAAEQNRPGARHEDDPYLNYNGQCAEAFQLYERCGGTIDGMIPTAPPDGGRRAGRLARPDPPCPPRRGRPGPDGL